MTIDEDRFIILTGGAGFIGSCVLRYLNDQGLSNIIVVDDFGKTEKWKNLVKKNYSDYLAKEHLAEWLEGRESEIQAFIHLGACSDTVETDAHYMMENNYSYSVGLAEYALKNDIRFIYASSAATYGDGSLGFSDDHDLLSELEPLNIYGYSKHLFDLWAKNQGVLKQIVGLKYFNVFGPNEFHKERMSSAVVHFIKQLKETGELCLFESSDQKTFSDGDQVRDFIYIKDAARMTCAFLDKQISGIYNIGSGVPNTWNTMAKGVFDGMGIDGKIKYIKMPSDLEGKYQNYTCADMKKFNATSIEGVKWRFEDAVVDYVKNYLIPRVRW
jgi:ADP-L-glycero-D-manno-heptose 6-epimerase